MEGIHTELFFVGKTQRSGLTEIVPLICTSPVWGHCPVFSHPWFPEGSLQGVAAVWWLRKGKYSLFLSWVPSGLTSSPLKVVAVADGCDIIFFTDNGRQHFVSHSQLSFLKVGLLMSFFFPYFCGVLYLLILTC